MTEVDGFLLLRKPIDVTSFGALSPVKKKLIRGTKVGHTGTLDRFAEGLLVVLCGRMTRLTPLIAGLEKEYEAELLFGTETTTLDPEGEVTAEGPVPDRETVEEAVASFVGQIEQIPPQYSAVHVGGERAYRAARAGRTVQIAPRTVVVHSLELLEYEAPTARVRVVCSSGTYIRALARDIAHRCGSFAHVRQLQRRRVGPFDLSTAVSPLEFDPDRDLGGWHDCLSRLPGVDEVEIRPAGQEAVLRGGYIDDRAFCELPADGTLAVYDRNGVFLALIERRDGRYHYRFVVPAARH